MSARPLSEVIGWLDGFLAVEGLRDYGPNGLQVEASDEVSTIAVGVTSNLACIEAAAEAGADLLVVHHGIYWDGAPYLLTGPLGRRVKALFAAGMSLAGYHLPLDGHPEVGNAVCLARELELEDLRLDFEHRGRNVGCIGAFPRPLDPLDLVERLCDRVSDRTQAFLHGPSPVRTLGIVTGGAPRDVARAVEAGCDAFLTGETGEYSQADARENGIHFLAAGHHRTERFGPQALARRLEEAFPGVDVTFIDIDNPA